MTIAPRRRPLSVAVVDDHDVVVHGVAAMLAPYRDRVQVVELSGTTSASQTVDIALVDPGPGAGAGTPAMQELVANPDVGEVVIYTWFATEDLRRTAAARGIRSVLLKSLAARELAEALTRPSERRTHAAPAAPCDPVSPVPTDERARNEQGLTPRESEMIALIADGMSNQDIAEHTYLSINSVKSYIRSAYQVMGVHSRTQAVLWGIDHGLTPTRVRVAPWPVEQVGTPAHELRVASLL